jgi:hypothetical protein
VVATKAGVFTETGARWQGYNFPFTHVLILHRQIGLSINYPNILLRSQASSIPRTEHVQGDHASYQTLNLGQFDMGTDFGSPAVMIVSGALSQ